MKELHDLTIESFHEGLFQKQFSAREVTQAYFVNIAAQDGEIGAYLSLMEEDATRRAETVDAKIARGEEVSPLAGVPLAIKDLILIEGFPATAGSKILEHHIASYDAGVIEKLKAQNAVFLGKTNLDAFGMGASTEHSDFKITKNPHDTTRVAGGSSGGSAAAIAADFALGALGTDTGGSIRQPAAFCGVVGLRPTYGSVSRSGVIALASSLDQVGPFAKTVRDAALMFNEIRGKDTMDATSTDATYGEELLAPKLDRIKTLAVGIPKEYFGEGISPEVRSAIEQARKTIESLGVKTKEISLPHTRYALSSYYIILPAEASANLARYDGIRYARVPEAAHEQSLRDLYFANRGKGFGTEPKRRIILGTFVLSSGYYDAYYKKAQEVRALIARDFEEAFKTVDVIMTPVTPGTAFKIGEKVNDPLSMYLEDIFTLPVNLGRVCAISIPVREKKEGLPVGFQLIGKPFGEADLLGLGTFYERACS